MIDCITDVPRWTEDVASRDNITKSYHSNKLDLTRVATRIHVTRFHYLGPFHATILQQHFRPPCIKPDKSLRNCKPVQYGVNQISNFLQTT